MGLEETFAATTRAYLLRIQKVERGFKKELKQREKGLHQMPNSSKFVVPRRAPFYGTRFTRRDRVRPQLEFAPYLPDGIF
jgi:hypothetical protein